MKILIVLIVLLFNFLQAPASYVASFIVAEDTNNDGIYNLDDTEIGNIEVTVYFLDPENNVDIITFNLTTNQSGRTGTIYIPPEVGRIYISVPSHSDYGVKYADVHNNGTFVILLELKEKTYLPIVVK